MLAAFVAIALALSGPPELLSDPDAKRLFGEAQAAFETGDYATASARLEAAYLIEPESALLYPWAQAERQLDHCKSAIELYQRFIDSNPSERMATAAKQNIERCEQHLAESTPTEPVPPPPGTDEEEAPFGPPDARTDDEPGKQDPPNPQAEKIGIAVGASLVGVGAVVAITGGTLIGLASGRAKATGEATSNTRYNELRKQATSLRAGGIAAVSIGGALLVGGIVQLAIVGAKRKQAKNSDVSMFFDGRTAAITWTGRF
jgi:hypothetical protein